MTSHGVKTSHAASNAPISQMKTIPRRTNALGWAKSDCHTCQASSRRCDRRRPRCDACTALGTVCNGYAQKLKWQDQDRQDGMEMESKRIHDISKTQETSKDARRTKEYSFVQEDGRRKRKYGNLRDARALVASSWLRERNKVAPVLYMHQPEYFQFGTTTLEQLAFFTWRFSPVTLTYKIEANPWQACLPQVDHAPCLLFAIRALSIRHRSHLEGRSESLSVLELKEQALSSYSKSLATVSLEVGISTSLILLAIDYTESAYGKWTIHLQGLLNMIEAAGGLRLGGASMNFKAQLAQMIWYDTVIALLSRSGPIFPREYVENILSLRSDSYWSMLALSGFPDAAFLGMYDAAKAAAHASSLLPGDVSSLEMSIWHARFDTEEDVADEEMSALTECWRLALLLYCTRVFHRSEDVKEKACILAEKVMRLVHSIPPHSDKQKQAAIPLFLAACELQSPYFRQIAIDFCARWKKKSGLWLNQTIIDLVRRVWSIVDDNPEKNIWWGTLIDPFSELCYLFG